MIEQIKKDLVEKKRVFLLDIDENDFSEVYEINNKYVETRDRGTLIDIPLCRVNEKKYKILYEEDVEGYIN